MIFRLRGKGVPNVHNNAVKGDLYVHVYVETPVKLNAEQKDLLRKFGESLERVRRSTPRRARASWKR